jgi:histone H3/H4
MGSQGGGRMSINEDLYLHKIIIQSVEIQIRDNDPPITKTTFERLLKNGHDEAVAKEMIASVIAEEIYRSMKDDLKMNLDNFARRLAELR